MDYHADEETARLIARSNQLIEKSRDVNERSASVSSSLMRLMARCNEVCAISDRLYGRLPPEGKTPPEDEL